MPGALFAAEILEATAAIDEVMAEAWLLQPQKPALEATAAPGADPSRAPATFAGTFLDPEAKPDMANSFDRRQVRRPGLVSGHTLLLVTPAAFAAVPGLSIKQSDLLERQADGVTWRVASSFLMAGGTLRLTLNIVG